MTSEEGSSVTGYARAGIDCVSAQTAMEYAICASMRLYRRHTLRSASESLSILQMTLHKRITDVRFSYPRVVISGVFLRATFYFVMERVSAFRRAHVTSLRASV